MNANQAEASDSIVASSSREMEIPEEKICFKNGIGGVEQGQYYTLPSAVLHLNHDIPMYSVRD
jgi:hypothetical protein